LADVVICAEGAQRLYAETRERISVFVGRFQFFDATRRVKDFDRDLTRNGAIFIFERLAAVDAARSPVSNRVVVRRREDVRLEEIIEWRPLVNVLLTILAKHAVERDGFSDKQELNRIAQQAITITTSLHSSQVISAMSSINVTIALI